MRYLSVCSGIEAATAAWHQLGWKPAAFSEIERFPRAVLSHHYPDVPLHGDFTTIGGDEYGPIDILVGGTPCQSFSIAGLRGGLADDRGNLALEFLRLADRTRPRWIVWENVPGVFSSLSHDAPDTCPPDIDLDASDGPGDGEEILVEDSYDAIESHSFGCFLAGLQELGYGAAYRVLDAQYAGVPQRRRRVFVVGYLGDWRGAAAVLFERHGLQGHPAPRREAGQVAPTVPSRSSAGGGLGTDFDCDGGLIRWPAKVAPTLNAHFGEKQGLEDQHINAGAGHFVPVEPFVLMERGRDGGSNLEYRADGTANAILTPNGGRNGFGVGAIAYTGDGVNADPISASEGKTYSHEGNNFRLHNCVALMENQRAEIRLSYATDAMSTGGGKPGQGYPALFTGSTVRRLTPRECERLQGFPDDFTAIPWRGKPASECPDGPRYKALGNSMAVPVMRWIGERIAKVESFDLEKAA